VLSTYSKGPQTHTAVHNCRVSPDDEDDVVDRNGDVLVALSADEVVLEGVLVCVQQPRAPQTQEVQHERRSLCSLRQRPAAAEKD
jgi:hypothetical protein